jgi:heterotetrameric sarcosine oxidase gamma subunit
MSSASVATEKWAQPVRLTALHRQHLALNASMVERSGWLVPASYGDPDGEMAAIHEQAGLLDIGESGKIDVKGRDLDDVLAELAPESRIEVGHSAPSGGITFLRLTMDQALLLAPPEDRQGVLERVQSAAAAHACANAVDITGALCGLRLLGPEAPLVLEHLCALDLAPDRFADGAVTQGAVAAIHAIIMRRDAAGGGRRRLHGYDLYVDRDLGAYLWGVILENGVRPVGRSVEEELD